MILCGGDQASTRVLKLEMHAEVRFGLVKPTAKS